MRIEKSCVPITVDIIWTNPNDVPTGTVFRYGDLTCGPYLKLGSGQALNFANNAVGSLPPRLDRYTPLPNAYLVTGEK